MADWDVVVVGGGAAGLSAAAVAGEAGLSCLVIDPMGGGGELMNLGPLQDCPGLEPGTTGPDLAASLLEAAIAAGAELGFGEVVSLTGGAPWSVATAEENHAARAVILACGLAPGRLGVADESAFEGQGLSHCAACDGPLYRGQPVVVAGADRWAVREALDLTAIASDVTLVTQGEAAPVVAGVRVVAGAVTGLVGESGLEAVLVGAERLPARAIFVQSGRRPALGFLAGALPLDAAGRLPLDAALGHGPPLLFAAGEVRAGGVALLREVLADGRRAGLAAAAALNPLGSPPK